MANTLISLGGCNKLMVTFLRNKWGSYISPTIIWMTLVNLSDLGQRSNDDLDLWYFYIFVIIHVLYSRNKLFVPCQKNKICLDQNCSWTLIIVSLKSSILAIFPYKRIMEHQVDLAVK